MFVTKEFVFDAAHYLPFYHGKCEKLHGHTWKMHVTVRGKIGPEGMAFDFVKLKEVVMERVIKKLDHQCINDLVPNPSAEHIALWSGWDGVYFGWRDRCVRSIAQPCETSLRGKDGAIGCGRVDFLSR